MRFKVEYLETNIVCLYQALHSSYLCSDKKALKFVYWELLNGKYQVICIILFTVTKCRYNNITFASWVKVSVVRSKKTYRYHWYDDHRMWRPMFITSRNWTILPIKRLHFVISVCLMWSKCCHFISNFDGDVNRVFYYMLYSYKT